MYMSYKKIGLISATFLSLMIGCTGKGPNIIINSDSKTTSTSDDEFSYEAPNSDKISAGASTSEQSQGLSIDWSKYNFRNLATVNNNGTFVVEAEDLDLSQATMQELCDHFYEYPTGAAAAITSNGACIACISYPTILGFKFECLEDCTITFIDRCAKYEDNYSLNQNATFWFDEEDPFVFEYSSFGHTNENQWYNWKDVEIGTVRVSKGTHMFQIQITGAFANTDCFKLVVTNYGA